MTRHFGAQKSGRNNDVVVRRGSTVINQMSINELLKGNTYFHLVSETVGLSIISLRVNWKTACTHAWSINNYLIIMLIQTIGRRSAGLRQPAVMHRLFLSTGTR